MRTELLRNVAAELTERFGGDLFIRLGPTLDPRSRSIVLEVIAPNTASAPVILEAGEDELYLTIGDSIDCTLFERHPIGGGAFAWGIERIVSAGERGVEMWRDSRRHLFGGQHQARIVGEPFSELSDKHRAFLSLSITTEPWTTPGVTLIADPIARSCRAHSVFFVDRDLPLALQKIATAVRSEFGSAISIVTRMDELGGTRILEVLPVDREASRMRVKELKSGEIALGTGDSQYFEYEFTPIAAGDAIAWVLGVGRLGLLETTVRRGSAYSFINGPSTPEAIEAAESNPRAGIEAKWKPWATSGG